MKQSNIELEIAPGNFIRATLDIDVSWDVDEYNLRVESVEVNGAERPDLYLAADAWVEANWKDLQNDAEQEEREWQDEVAISYAQDRAFDRIQYGE